MAKNMKLRAFNIKYDLEGVVPPHLIKDTLKSLPSEVIVETLCNGATSDELEELLSDSITDETGFCHKGFEWEEIVMDNLNHKELIGQANDIIVDMTAFIGSLFMIGILNDKHPLYPEVLKMKKRGDEWREKAKEFINDSK